MPRWAVLGKTNVGKSSFLNALLHPATYFRSGRTPGVTRGLVAVEVWLGKSPQSKLELVDLPGFAYSERSAEEHDRWSTLADALRQQSRSKPLEWLYLVDPSRAPDSWDEQVLGWLMGEPYNLVFTKADRVSMNDRKKILERWKPWVDSSAVVPAWVSSTNGEGFNTIASWARQFVKSAGELSRGESE